MEAKSSNNVWAHKVNNLINLVLFSLISVIYYLLLVSEDI